MKEKQRINSLQGSKILITVPKNNKGGCHMKTTISKSAVFRVFISGELVDTVFYVSSMTADEVRRSLIDHDGYMESIKVVKEV